MNGEDSELERLKAKRLAEMQKNISARRQSEEPKMSEKNRPTPRDTVLSKLGYRGLEVLENAEAQFPNEAKLITGKLAKLIESEEIKEELDGGKILTLFRTIGLNIRMDTKINVEQDGKFVSLSDKLLSRTNGDEKRA